jgi:Flp pilus assembly protein TadG
MGTLRAKPRNVGGQGVVEFAVALPFLLLILLGTIDAGRVFFDYIEMRNAAVEGATYGSRNPTDVAGITAATLAHGIPADATVAVTTSGVCTRRGGTGDLTVSTSRVWTPVSLDALQLVGADVAWSFTMMAASTMRCLT